MTRENANRARLLATTPLTAPATLTSPRGSMGEEVEQLVWCGWDLGTEPLGERISLEQWERLQPWPTIDPSLIPEAP